MAEHDLNLKEHKVYVCAVLCISDSAVANRLVSLNTTL